jgi:hypothetical protein
MVYRQSNRVRRDRARFVLLLGVRGAACAPGGAASLALAFASRCQCLPNGTLDDMPHFETAFVTRRGQSRGLRAPRWTPQTTKNRRTGSGRPARRPGRRAAAQFPSVRRPSPRAMVVLAHDHSHIPFPSCNYTLVHIHTHERTAQAIVSGEGQFAVRTRAHAATPSASQHVSKHPTGRHGSGGTPARAASSQSRVRGDV